MKLKLLSALLCLSLMFSLFVYASKRFYKGENETSPSDDLLSSEESESAQQLTKAIWLSPQIT